MERMGSRLVVSDWVGNLDTPSVQGPSFSALRLQQSLYTFCEGLRLHITWNEYPLSVAARVWNRNKAETSSA